MNAETHRPGRERERVLYRLEVVGPVGSEWVDWLEAEALTLIVSSQISPVRAQERWGMEFRANGAIATRDADRDTRKNGVGFEANVQYRFFPHLGAYVGWDWTHFSALESVAGPNMDLEETGYAFGLRFQHPVREGSRTSWWVRGGGI